MDSLYHVSNWSEEKGKKLTIKDEKLPESILVIQGIEIYTHTHTNECM